VNDEQFAAITTKLDAITRLLAMSAIEGKQLKQQVSLLHSLGLQPREIADVLGKTPNHIRVLLHELRKEASEEVDKNA
jgi:DNA-directed RNA polymerase specialized sigma24 family protein